MFFKTNEDDFRRNLSSGFIVLGAVMQATQEQALIRDYQGRQVVCSAKAGTGKTTVLSMYADAHSSERILYLAFNAAIKKEAESKFPRNVTCKTLHGLAYAAVGYKYRHKLVPNLRFREVSNFINSTNWLLVKDVCDTLKVFLNSDSKCITKEHFERMLLEKKPNYKYIESVITETHLLWHSMKDISSKMPITHDGYLKIYQQSKPDLSSSYNTICFDEAQDSNAVTNALVFNQQCKLLIVGDDSQAIYGWRGASNSLHHPFLKNADRLYLTQSFRFGPEVAKIANLILWLKREPRPVNGFEQINDKVVIELTGKVNHLTVINRTVFGVIETALHYSASNKKIYWVGGIENYDLSDLQDLHYFSKDEKDLITNQKMFKDYEDFAEYCLIAETTKDHQMRRGIKIIKRYGNQLPDLIDYLKESAADNEKDASVTVTTAHRAKGLEWTTVILEDDFMDVLDPEMDDETKNAELNLLYVASTRAKQMLVINELIEKIQIFKKRVDKKYPKNCVGKM